MGFVFGAIGQVISLAGFQSALSIVLGVLVIVSLFLPISKTLTFFTNNSLWKNTLGNLFRKKSYRDDAPVFKQHTIDDFKAILSPFSEVIVTSDRFPYKTDRDNNIQTVLYNFMIVPAFNLIPKKFLKNYGHHIIAKAVK